MRAFIFVLLVPWVGLSACDGEDDGESAATGGSEGFGGAGSGGGSGEEIVFEDLPGQIRFVNFVSDGESGVNLDLYFGGSLDQSEFVETIEYGEITEFIAPRRPVDTLLSELLDPDEARYFLVREGDTTSLASRFLVMSDESFEEETRITVTLAAGEALSGSDLVVSSQLIFEHLLPVPDSDECHVYAWGNAFAQISGGDFVLVATSDVCDPERVSAVGNIGQAAVVSPEASGLFLTDANSECSSGSTPAEGDLEPGASYVLLGKADTYELDAREAVLLKLTVGE